MHLDRVNAGELSQLVEHPCRDENLDALIFLLIDFRELIRTEE